MATLFAVGLPFTFDGTTSHFATTTGGTASVANPTTADTVTFDGLSGTGTCTFTVDMSCSTFTMSSANVTLAPGTHTITCAGTGSAWNVTAGTFTAGTSNIALTDTSATSKTFVGASLTYATVTFSIGTGITVITGNNNYTTLTATGSASKSGTLQSNNATQTISGTFTVTGNSATNRILMQSNIPGVVKTYSAGAVSLSNVDFKDITGAGAATWSGTSLGDAGGNSNITFDTPVSTALSGASPTWSTGTWSVRIPLPQDSVTTTATGTITIDMPRFGKDIDLTGFAGTLTHAIVGGAAFYGSMTLGSGMTFTASGGNSYNASGRGTHTYTSNGAGVAAVTFTGPGGTYTLQDSFAISSALALTLNDGTLNTNGVSLSIGSFISTATRACTLSLSASTVTLLGTATVWNVSDASLAINASSSTIVISDTGATVKTFAGGSKAYNFVIFRQALDSARNSVTGANTYSGLIYRDSRMANNNYAFAGAGDGMSVSEKIR